MDKEFIPYEQALKLEELGFKPTPIGGFRQDAVFYYENGNLYYDYKPMYSSTAHPGQILAPLYQQAFRWFRENYDIHYSIDRECSQHDFKWGYNWSLYNWTGIFDEYLTSAPDAPVGEWVYNTHEEAELDCLKKLIEIVKHER